MSRATQLLHALRAADDFRASAVAILRHLEHIVDAALLAGDWSGARLLRTLVHLRDDAGYVGAWALEAGSEALGPPRGGEELLPSATAWRRVASTGRPATLDVQLRTVTGADGTAETVRWAERRPEALPEASHLRLMAREATHVAALPLQGPRGVRGLISIEVRCRAAIGTPFVWPSCLDALETAAAIAGPWLLDRADTAAPPGTADGPHPDDALPVIGPSMQGLVQLAEAFAAEDETLLIRGESGTGKSRLARWCHGRSARHGGPFEVLDLLGVPQQTQFGELFGWRRGAFTGAVRDHEGAVARAEGGTLFIDEIDKLSLEAQAGLLRLLEDRTYRPLGDQGAERQADVRFIVGTNIALQAAAAEGRFRADLMYRIDVLPIALPPLRQRTDEIAAWGRFMLQRMATDRGRPPRALSEGATRHLERCPWPGNLRELDNVLRRASTLAGLDGDDATIEPRHLIRAAGLSSAAGGARGASLDDGLDALLRALDDPAVAPDGIDWPGALNGLLLGRAVRHTGDLEQAFDLLGRGDVVKNRNHRRTMKREWHKALELLDRIGRAPSDRTPPG